jgi:hypothetical protein
MIETGDYLLIAERARPDAVRARHATAGPG